VKNLVKIKNKFLKMKYPYTLPQLPYSYDAFEPYIDKMTMEIHHSRHHQAYVNNLNSVLEKYPEFHDIELEDILKDLNKLPEEIRTTVKNNGGGHYNHSLFWEIMKPNGGGEPDGELKKAIEENFGSFENFKNLFSEIALKHFGSGWAWLVVTPDKKLKAYSLPNQDNPLSDGYKLVMALDVWEHAYYLKYQNRRNEYIQNWWNVVNWDKIKENYLRSIS
jgi:Fe-Mn family superoxide dismutase